MADGSDGSSESASSSSDAEGGQGQGQSYEEESGGENWGRYSADRTRGNTEVWNSSDITLAGIVAKCFPLEAQARGLADEGNAHLQLGNLSAARQAYRKALSLQPRSHLILANLCLAYLSPQRAPAAAAAAAAASRPRAGKGRGHGVSARADVESALKVARRAVWLVPSWPKGQFRLGQALEAHGQLVPAAAAFYSSARLSASAPVPNEAYVSAACVCAVNAALAALERVGRRVRSKGSGARARGVESPGAQGAAVVALREAALGVWKAFGRGEGGWELNPEVGAGGGGVGEQEVGGGDGDGEGACGAAVLEERLQKCIQALKEEDGIKCQVCYELLCLPVTTPCGHSFCTSCLERLLDHGNVCPICRRDLRQFRRRWHYVPNAALTAIVARNFPTDVAARIQEIKTIANDPVGSAGRGTLLQEQAGQVCVCACCARHAVAPAHLPARV